MKINQIFTNGMVLQANKPIKLYGTGSGTVTAQIADNIVKGKFTGDKWLLTLPELTYGGPYDLYIDLNGEKLTFSDVYVGEVILLAGQSNIAMSLGGSSYPKSDYEENPLVRCFNAKHYEGQGHFHPEDGWVKCTIDNAQHFSAIGYHLATQMSKEKGITVGIIACYMGSSVIESWLPAEIADDERFYLPKEEKYDSPYVHGPHNISGTLYGVRQQSIVPYSIGNVVWYQGESNTGKGEWKIYTDLLEALIKRWREDFMDENLPFAVVQIADWDERNDDAWHGIQKSQEKIVERTHNVKVIKSADVCETFDIHPPTKINLSKRIYEAIK
ncbi:MAG: sialate O-acetylesterase [Ruminococcaceae bacterium]|nr:sialate O-acetylesterase [Oscillospiraceae bacterium]